MAKITLNFDSADMQNAIKKIKKLESFDKKRTKIISILRSSAKPLLNDMKGRAPVSDGGSHRVKTKSLDKVVRPGSLKRSHGIMRSKNRKIAQVLVGFRGGKKAGKNEGFYGGFVNKGKGNHSSANPYISNSIKSVGPSVKATVSERLKAQLKAL